MNNFSSTKFIFAVVCVIAINFSLYLKLIDSPSFTTSLITIFSVYCGANVGEKIFGKQTVGGNQ